MNITAYDLAARFSGLEEVSGRAANPQILAMLQLDSPWPTDDEVHWCSAFLNYIAWLLRLPRSKSLAARSWLGIGVPVLGLGNARCGFDVVVLSRGSNSPGPEVLAAPGHVGFFGGMQGNKVLLLGGNQSDSVCLAPYPVDRILGIRRLREE